MRNIVIALLVLLASAGSLAAAPWQKISQSIGDSVQSIGTFSNGCIVGVEALPLSTTDYQVMRADQRHYFGHPDLAQFIQRLNSRVHNKGMGAVLIGDMGIPVGGRLNGGHAGHQTGLDVDIFLQLPQTRRTSSQLLRPQALDLVASDGKHVVPLLRSPQISQLIKLMAGDNKITRIFINSAIKQQPRLDTGSNRQRLRKVRPWFQHRVHMYVRLRCPAGNLEREGQAPPPPGDDCGAELQSWFESSKPESAPPMKRTPPPLPPSCQTLLDGHAL